MEFIIIKVLLFHIHALPNSRMPVTLAQIWSWFTNCLMFLVRLDFFKGCSSFCLINFSLNDCKGTIIYSCSDVSVIAANYANNLNLI